SNSARDTYQQALALKRNFTFTCLVAQLSKEIKDEPTRSSVIEAMEKEVANPTDKAARTAVVDKAGMLLLDIVKNGKPSKEKLEAFEGALVEQEEADHDSTVGWCYFVGNELEAAGQEKEAEKYWRRALVNSSSLPMLATLAGAKLAEHNHTSRPDGDVLTA